MRREESQSLGIAAMQSRIGLFAAIALLSLTLDAQGR